MNLREKIEAKLEIGLERFIIIVLVVLTLIVYGVLVAIKL